MTERLPDGTVFGSYTLEGLIASGGMGQVYAARHNVFGNTVALKVLHPSLHADEDWRARFNEEGLVGTGLKHPHVLSARELVHDDGRIALVLDLVHGGQTLEKVIVREFREGITLVQALRVYLKILQGIDYLHGKGIVHGDLKPENVLLEGDFRRPETWVPKVTDFGTVALIAHPVEIDGRPAVVATPRYASPEHLYGVDRIEVRSDIYCLGLILHFLLTGRHASNAQNVREAADRVMLPVPIVNLVDQPDALIEVFKTATSVDPDGRQGSVRELALGVRSILDAIGAELELPDVAADLATEVDEERQAKRTPDSSGSQVSTEAHPAPSMRELPPDPPSAPSVPEPGPAEQSAPEESKGVAFVAPADDEESPTEEDAKSPKHTAPPAPTASAPSSRGGKPPPISAAGRGEPLSPPPDDGGVPLVAWVAGAIALVLLIVIAIWSWPG